MPDKEIFGKLINTVKFDINEYLNMDISEAQKKTIEDATQILKDNIVGEVIKIGGNVQKNKEKFDLFLKSVETELQKEEYANFYKEFKQIFKDYSKKLREMIERISIAIIPVKEMPWVEVIFGTIPRIEIENDNEIALYGNNVMYYGEIKCVIPRTTIYGKIKNQEPLFAPYIGELDLEGYQIDQIPKDQPRSQCFSYINALMNSLDSSSAKNQLAKYHEGYQRHGEPICDFFMNKKDLLESMKKVSSGLESGRIKSEISICGIALPLASDKSTLLLMANDKSNSQAYSECFEALLKFSAACCEAVTVLQERSPEPAPQKATQEGAPIRTAGGQELKVWTEAELAEEARRRGAEIPSNIEIWKEEDLRKLAEERAGGIPEGIEVWTEEELVELAKKRESGLSIPEWKPDSDLIECPKCGYSLRKSWSECPICETPIDVKKISEPTDTKEEKPKPSENDQNHSE